MEEVVKKLIISILTIASIMTWISAAPADSGAAKPKDVDSSAAQASAATGDSLKDQLTNIKGAVDGVKEDFLATKSTVDKLSKIKISGYTQVQFRMATDYKKATDTTGTGVINSSKKSSTPGTYLYPVGDFAGGKIGTGIGSLLQIRRARIKVAYETDLTQGVIQADFLPFTAANALGTSTSITNAKDTTGGRKFDTSVTMTQKPAAYLNGGGVTIKDVYLRFTEPWLKLFSIRGGVFNRPFGFEISQSSGDRESPERSRTEQTLFPGERDLGASLEMLPGDNAPAWLQYFNFRGGAFTGNGINVESDNQRDLIGRFGISCPFKEIGLGIDAGSSGYFGNVTDWNDAAYTFNKTAMVFTKSTGNYDKTVQRKYYDGDVQLYYSLPVIGGLTLRGEVYKGIQPASSSSSSSLAGPNALVVDLNNTSAVYSRNFLGYYAMWVQNIDPLRSQFVLKYDSYDPNTDIKGTDIDSAKVVGGVSPADLMFNTVGIGWVYHWDENIKFVAYLDMPKNEKVNSGYLSKNSSFWPYLVDMKANVFTFRIQYKF
jgi:hypothetical protein